MADTGNWAARAQAAAAGATDVMREISAEIFKTAHIGQMIPLRQSGQDKPWAVYTVVAAMVSSQDPTRPHSSFEPMLARLDTAGPVLFPPARAGYAYPNPTFDGFRPAGPGDLATLLRDYPAIDAELSREVQNARSRGLRPTTPAGHALPNAQVPTWEGH